MYEAEVFESKLKPEMPLKLCTPWVCDRMSSSFLMTESVRCREAASGS